MINSLSDIIRPRRNLGFAGGEGELLNEQAYQGEDQNALRPMITNQSLGQDRQMPQMNTMTGPSGQVQQFQSARPIQLAGGKTGYQDQQGNVTIDTDAGQQTISAAQLAANDREAQRQQELANLQRQAQLHQLRVQAGIAPKEVKDPHFDADLGGYVYPPDAQNPQGRFVAVAGAKREKSAAEKAPTEDQAKAAGWFNQAQNAYENLTKSMTDPVTGQVSYKAATPTALEGLLPSGMKGAVQSPERQRFAQAASSMSEAMLRAATGAGVNKEEAAQKIAELTPTYWDDETTKKQKLDAIPMYLKSLQTRAGRASVITPEIKPMNIPEKGRTSNAPTEADIRHTAMKHGVSVEEVKRRLGL